jgi:hypothetical protein
MRLVVDLETAHTMLNTSNRASNPKKQCDSSGNVSGRERSNYKQIWTITHVRKRRNCLWHANGQGFESPYLH